MSTDKQTSQIGKLTIVEPPPGAPIFVWVDPASLDENPENWREHPPEQDALVTDLIKDKKIGWADVCLYNSRTGEFINGHLRRKIALREGITAVPVMVGQWDKAQQRAIHAALDMSTGLAKTNPPKLQELILGAGDAFPSDRANELVRSMAGKLGVDWDKAPQPGAQGQGDGQGDGQGERPPDAEAKIAALLSKWGCIPGLVYGIPSKTVPNHTHRIMCGDCTNPDDVEKLTRGRQPSIMMTSPPYDQQRTYGGLSDWNSLMRGMSDALPVPDDAQLFVNLGLIYRDYEWVEYWQDWMRYMNQLGWRRAGWYIWDQLGEMPGDWDGRLCPAFEFIFQFNTTPLYPNKIKPTTTEGNRYKAASCGFGQRKPTGELESHNKDHVTGHFKAPSAMIRAPRGSSQKSAHLHPAIYSPQLVIEVIRAYGADGDLVYDPFAGSGTTVRGAELCRREAYCMEINPGYLAVALECALEAGLAPNIVS